MKPRTPFIAANWKMNPPPTGACAEGTPYFSTGHPQIVVFPTFIDLQNCIRSKELIVGAQCGRPESLGAFTGDINMQQLKDFGCTYVLCGHSERRQHHHESDEFIAEQVSAALDAGLTPILCIGETADERELGQAEEVVQRQLQTVINVISSKLKAARPTASERENCFLIVAYEPVWAIGSGKTASAKDAQDMHAFIRSLLPSTLRNDIRIIYGGSVKPTNAAALIAEPDIDGFLVGASSLHLEEFQAIINAAS